MWTQRDIKDMTFIELCDIHEFLDVKEKNEADFHAWRKTQEA